MHHNLRKKTNPLTISSLRTKDTTFFSWLVAPFWDMFMCIFNISLTFINCGGLSDPANMIGLREERKKLQEFDDFDFVDGKGMAKGAKFLATVLLDTRCCKKKRKKKRKTEKAHCLCHDLNGVHPALQVVTIRFLETNKCNRNDNLKVG